MDILRGFLSHMGIICSFICLIAKALDWYNPYMDFSGRVWAVQMILYLTVILLASVGGHRHLKCGKKRKYA